MMSSEERNLVQSKDELTEIQRFIVDVAEELLTKEKLERLYPLELLEITKKRGNYPENELFQNITTLYEGKWIIPDENLTKNLVLSIENYRRVYQFVVENPGSDTLDVMNGLGVSFRFALKSLETLFKFRFIRAHKYSQYFLYFPSYMDEEGDKIYCLARNATIRQILHYLMNHRTAATTYEIAQAINRTEITVLRKLTRLALAQLVSISDDGLITKYKLNKDNINGLEQILEMYDKHD